jgi:hypothetical protein
MRTSGFATRGGRDETTGTGIVTVVVGWGAARLPAGATAPPHPATRSATPQTRRRQALLTSLEYTSTTA